MSSRAADVRTDNEPQRQPADGRFHVSAHQSFSLFTLTERWSDIRVRLDRLFFGSFGLWYLPWFYSLNECGILQNVVVLSHDDEIDHRSVGSLLRVFEWCPGLLVYNLIRRMMIDLDLHMASHWPAEGWMTENLHLSLLLVFEVEKQEPVEQNRQTEGWPQDTLIQHINMFHFIFIMTN